MAQQPTTRVELDEDWLRDWVAYGFAEMELYLQRHAQFAAYLANQPEGHDDHRRTRLHRDP